MFKIKNFCDENNNYGIILKSSDNSLKISSEKDIYLTLLVDKSGSMITKVNNIPRYKIISQAIFNCLQLLNKLYNEGRKIKLGLYFFDAFAHCQINYKYINNNIIKLLDKELIDIWCYPGSGTNFNDAIQLSKTFFDSFELDNNINNYVVLVSDGYNSGPTTDEELSNKYKNYINTSIGLGNLGEYHDELFKNISKKVFGAKNIAEIDELISSTIFSLSTHIATDIKIMLPSNIKFTNGKQIINLDTFNNYQSYIFSVNSMTPFILKIGYKYNNEYNEQLFNISYVNYNSKITSTIKYYSYITNKLYQRQNDISMGELKRFLKELEVITGNKDVDTNIQLLQNQIKKILNSQSNKEYKDLLYQTSLQASECIYNKFSYSMACSYMDINEEDLLCILCYKNERRVIFRPCNHMVCCVECTKKYIDNNKECPICRGQINHIYEVKIPSYAKNMMCTKCNKNKIKSMFSNCNHALFCSTCAYEEYGEKGNCKHCNRLIMRIINFII